MHRKLPARAAPLIVLSTVLLGPVRAQWSSDQAKVAEALRAVDEVIVAGPYAATAESLQGHRVPAWYLDAKFGIFVRWGLSSVPAFGDEDYPREMYRKGSEAWAHHRKSFGDPEEVGYADFIASFAVERFDPARWAGLFERAGARFVVQAAENADGFAMGESGFTDYCAARMGPNRDVVAELATAVRAAGLVFGVATSRAENWWYYDTGRVQKKSDVARGGHAALYGPAQPAPKDPNDRRSRQVPEPEFLDDWLARTCELVDRYRPQLVWFDRWARHEAFEPYNRRFAAYYLDRAAGWRTEVVIEAKAETFPPGVAVETLERGRARELRADPWQADTALSKDSWGYVDDDEYATAGQLVDDLVDVVSKGGTLLLGVAPKADGSIPGAEVQTLVELGKWLQLNGEAIYGTRPWQIFGEGPTQVVGGELTESRREEFTGQDVRFTTKGKTLYAICLDWPGETVVIHSLVHGRRLWFGEIGEIELVGKPGRLAWGFEADGLVVHMPKTRPCDHAFVLKLTGGGDE